MIIDAFFQLGFRITELHAGSVADVLETVFFPIDLEIPAKIFERVLKNRMCIEYILQRLMNITQSISQGSFKCLIIFLLFIIHPNARVTRSQHCYTSTEMSRNVHQMATFTRLLRITPGSSFRFHAVAHTCTCTLKYIVKKVVCAGNTGCNIQIIIPSINQHTTLTVVTTIPEIRYLERRRCSVFRIFKNND